MSDEYLELLDAAVAMAEDAKLAASASHDRGEQPAVTLLDYAERIQTIVAFLRQRIPSRWRIDIDD